jgi:hypothetical protein
MLEERMVVQEDCDDIRREGRWEETLLTQSLHQTTQCMEILETLEVLALVIQINHTLDVLLYIREHSQFRR